MHRKKIPETGCGAKLNQTRTQVAEHACTLSEIISINVHTLCPRVCVCVCGYKRKREGRESHPSNDYCKYTATEHIHTHTYSRTRAVSVYCQSDKSQQTLSELVQQL